MTRCSLVTTVMTTGDLVKEIFPINFSCEVSHELRDEVRAGAGGGLRGEVQEDLLHRVRAEGVL